MKRRSSASRRERNQLLLRLRLRLDRLLTDMEESESEERARRGARSPRGGGGMELGLLPRSSSLSSCIGDRERDLDGERRRSRRSW